MKNRSTPAPRLASFARMLLQEWRRLELPTEEATFVVAVSGGADSTALLLGLDELQRNNKLGVELIVAHLDHVLRSDSKEDARFVSGLAKDLGLKFVTSKANLKKSTKTNIEQAARDVRYEFLARTAKANGAAIVLTAHTLDDQAETILLRLLRGSSADGLAGMSVQRPLNEHVQLVRLLLSWARRSDTENYCHSRKVQFRLDEMNEDESFGRVRVRKQLLPLMQSFNNRIVNTLSRTGTLLREDAAALNLAANELLESAAVSNGARHKRPTLDVHTLLQSPASVRRRALREWILRGRGDLRRLEMVHLTAVEGLLHGQKGGRIAELPGGMRVGRRRGTLQLLPKKKLKKAETTPKIPRH